MHLTGAAPPGKLVRCVAELLDCRRTRSLVPGPIWPSLPLSTFETVLGETPARLATS